MQVFAFFFRRSPDLTNEALVVRQGWGAVVGDLENEMQVFARFLGDDDAGGLVAAARDGDIRFSRIGFVIWPPTVPYRPG